MAKAIPRWIIDSVVNRGREPEVVRAPSGGFSLGEAPKSMVANLLWRRELLNMGEEDPRKAAVIRKLFHEDILFGFNSFFWLHDSRFGGEDVFPFTTWPYQDEAILKINSAIERGEDVFIDKSRDMGATYIVLYVFLWRFLTRKGEHFRIGSFKEDMVDKQGDMGTHFEKLRFNLRLLPFFILPLDWNIDKHSTWMKLYNPEKRCTIIGEATNKHFSAGTRPKAILFDEFARWEMADEAWRSASDATRCKIPLSTPQGMGNKFAELARSDEIRNKIHLMWWLNPLKAVTSSEYLTKIELSPDQSQAPKGCFIDRVGKIRSEWYDNECAKRDHDDIAENLDCNYLTSGRPFFDTNKCEQNLRKCVSPKFIGNLLWKTRPVFDSNGYCINKDQLEVEFVENHNGIYKIWEMPVNDWNDGYAVSADVSEGLEQGDFSSGSVVKRFEHPLETVATIHCKLKHFEYGEELAKLSIFYCRATLAIERTGQGIGVIDHTLKFYDNLFFKQKVARGFTEQTNQIGWDTNKATKPLICENLSKMITFDEFVDNDEGFWRECLTFMNNDGKLEAQGKSRGQKLTDDRVMDRAILYHIHSEISAPSKKRRKTQVDYWQRLYRTRKEGSLVGWVLPKGV